MATPGNLRGDRHRRLMLCTLTILLAASVTGVAQDAGPGPFPVYNIKDHGAVGDGTTLNTRAIQTAIDHATGAGGGTVFFPPGHYVTGTIQLKDNVTLYL